MELFYEMVTYLRFYHDVTLVTRMPTKVHYGVTLVVWTRTEVHHTRLQGSDSNQASRK